MNEVAERNRKIDSPAVLISARRDPKQGDLEKNTEVHSCVVKCSGRVIGLFRQPLWPDF